MAEALAAWLEPWAALYGDQAALSTAILAGHLLALFVGGGVAVAADRTVLRAMPATADDHRRVADELHATHALVVALLGATMATGLLMAAADVATYAASAVYWCKMGGVALLLVNGVLLRRAESAVRHPATQGSGGEAPVQAPVQAPADAARIAGAWSAMRAAARRSLFLWCGLVVLGVLLSNG
jgi:hypothetical protein